MPSGGGVFVYRCSASSHSRHTKSYVKTGLDTSKAALLVLIGADADG